jgi:hypothetical protein
MRQIKKRCAPAEEIVMSRLITRSAWSVIRRWVVGCAILAFTGAAARAEAGAVYTTFDPPGSVNTYATCMSDNGMIAGNYYDSSNVSHGFVRAIDGTIASFDPAGSVDTTAGYARCINKDGWVAGSYEDANQVWHGYLRAPDGQITVFDPEGSTRTYVSGINSGRTTVGYYKNAGGRQLAFFRTADGTITSFHLRQDTWASGINRKGDILGSACTNMPPYEFCRGFVRKPDQTYRNLGDVNPEDMNDAGDVTGDVPGYCWTVCTVPSFVRAPGGKLTEFSPGRSRRSSGNCINQKGLIAGTYWRARQWHGYTRSIDGAIRYFDPPDSTSTSVTGCAARDTVAGNYLDSNGVSHGFLRSR